MVVCNVCFSRDTQKASMSIVETYVGVDSYGGKTTKSRTVPLDLDFCEKCRNLLKENKFEELGKRAANFDKAVVDSLKRMADTLDHDK